MEALKQLARDFFLRDPRKLYTKAKAEGLNVTVKQCTEALKSSVMRQVLAPPPRSLGKSAAGTPHTTFQADLIDYSQNTDSKKHGGHKYAALLVDVFTREAKATPLRDKQPETVNKAIESDLRRTGAEPQRVISTDAGGEFSQLDKVAIHRTKEPQDRNGIAVVDRTMQT